MRRPRQRTLDQGVVADAAFVGAGRYLPPQAAADNPLSRDFGDDVTGAFPAGFTSRWSDTNHTAAVREKAGASGGKTFEHVSSAAANRFFSLDAAGDIADQEVLVKVRVTGTGTSGQGGAIVRGGGSAASQQGYYCSPVSGVWRVSRLVGNVNTTLGSTGVAFAADTWFWVRLRVVGTTVSAKVWADGGAEPGAWQYTTTDANVASGRPGIFAGTATTGSTRDWDDVRVALDGATA